MIVLHFVTSLFPPARGGLENWTLALAKSLSGLGVKTMIYVLSAAQHDYAAVARREAIEVHHIGQQRAILEEPLVGSGWTDGRIAGERWRLDYLLLYNAIAAEVASRPEGRHIVASSFITSEGFVASMVSEELSLPHVACVVGTDYSRGFRDPRERSTIAAVVQTATCIVTTNRQQEHALRRNFGVNNVRTIHRSVPDRVFLHRWRRSKRPTVDLFSDGGYSFKKGTHVLMKAFSALRNQGLPITLSICGASQAGQEQYWSRMRADHSVRFGPAVMLDGYVEPLDLWNMMLRHDVYCSATLGEGCSVARAAALCIGIPIVTTLCGEMIDIGTGVSHVRLSAPGDADAFTAELEQAFVDVFKEGIDIDSEKVEAWRTYFAPHRELQQWEEVLRFAAQH